MHVKKSFRYNKNHWWMALMMAGSLGGLPTFFFMSRKLILPAIAYLLLLFIFGTLGLLQRRYFESRQILGGTYFKLYSYGGFGATVVILLLWLNFLLPWPQEYAEKHLIREIVPEYSYSRNSKRFVGYRIVMDDDFQFSRSSLTLGDKPAEHQPYVVFRYKYGLLGIRRITGYYYTDQPG